MREKLSLLFVVSCLLLLSCSPAARSGKTTPDLYRVERDAPAPGLYVLDPEEMKTAVRGALVDEKEWSQFMEKVMPVLQRGVWLLLDQLSNPLIIASQPESWKDQLIELQLDRNGDHFSLSPTEKSEITLARCVAQTEIVIECVVSEFENNLKPFRIQLHRVSSETIDGLPKPAVYIENHPEALLGNKVIVTGTHGIIVPIRFNSEELSRSESRGGFIWSLSQSASGFVMEWKGRDGVNAKQECQLTEDGFSCVDWEGRKKTYHRR